MGVNGVNVYLDMTDIPVRAVVVREHSYRDWAVYCSVFPTYRKHIRYINIQFEVDEVDEGKRPVEIDLSLETAEMLLKALNKEMAEAKAV